MCVLRVGGFRVQAVGVSELLGVFRLVFESDGEGPKRAGAGLAALDLRHPLAAARRTKLHISSEQRKSGQCAGECGPSAYKK